MYIYMCVCIYIYNMGGSMFGTEIMNTVYCHRFTHRIALNAPPHCPCGFIFQSNSSDIFGTDLDPQADNAPARFPTRFLPIRSSGFADDCTGY